MLMLLMLMWLIPCFRCNEELNDKVVIKRLKLRISELETELQVVKTSGHEVNTS